MSESVISGDAILSRHSLAFHFPAEGVAPPQVEVDVFAGFLLHLPVESGHIFHVVEHLTLVLEFVQVDHKACVLITWVES